MHKGKKEGKKTCRNTSVYPAKYPRMIAPKNKFVKVLITSPHLFFFSARKRKKRGGSQRKSKYVALRENVHPDDASSGSLWEIISTIFVIGVFFDDISNRQTQYSPRLIFPQSTRSY